MLKVLKLSDLKRWPWLFEWKTFLFNPQCSSNLNLTRIYNTYNTHILWTTMNDVYVSCVMYYNVQCVWGVQTQCTVHSSALWPWQQTALYFTTRNQTSAVAQWTSPHHNNADQVREAGHVWSVVVKIGILNTRKDLFPLTQWMLISKHITWDWPSTHQWCFSCQNVHFILLFAESSFKVCFDTNLVNC